jgi:endonuclease G
MSKKTASIQMKSYWPSHLILILAILVGCAKTQTRSVSDRSFGPPIQHRPEIHCKHYIHGIPYGTPDTNDLIIRDGYALSSNDRSKFADWVAYRLEPWMLDGETDAGRDWVADPWLSDEETLEPDDYLGAYETINTDRGHQAPLADFRGTPYQHETNYLSNVTPQRSVLNRGPWKTLEDEIRSFVRAGNVIYVITGPYYDGRMKDRLPGADEEHTVPNGYWKIIMRHPNLDWLDVIAFVFPQDIPGGTDYRDYVSSIDEVERTSELDFLWELPDDLEDVIEGNIRPEWFMGRR